MNAQESLVDQLEVALAGKALSRRAEVLSRVTDLFALGSSKLSEAQIDVFGDVMSKLVESIESAACASFSNRIATLPDAPRKLIQKLAFDDAIEVAGPVLAQSEQLCEKVLLENAATMSQAHLLAISQRRVLPEALTDVLIDRGDQRVVCSTAENAGAKFSSFGVSTLVRKSVGDDNLAMCVWSRLDIPRQELLQLFLHVSEDVRTRLEAAFPRQAQLVRAAVASASDEIQSKVRAGSYEHTQAQSYVNQLHSAGALDESCLLTFANEGSFDRTAIALSLKCELPISLVERALAPGRSELILIFAKAADLSWKTTKEILRLQSGRSSISKAELDQSFTSFSRLQIKTARTALQFYRLREQANEDSSSR